MKKYNICVSTNLGKLRSENEDSFVLNHVIKDKAKSVQNIRGQAVVPPLLCGVFDGMGGERGGMEASDTAAVVASEYSRFLAEQREPAAKSIEGYVTSCNDLIHRYLEENRLNRGGTTFAFAFLHHDCAELFAMGDSRIYLYREGALRQISRDHTLAQKKLEANIYTKEEAETSSDSHVLTRFLGMDSDSDDCRAEEYEPVILRPSDKLLLCSDGLYDMCSDREIAETLSRSDAPGSLLLVEAALNNGGKDNVTCLVIEAIE